jgi:hypothetical protein
MGPSHNRRSEAPAGSVNAALDVPVVGRGIQVADEGEDEYSGDRRRDSSWRRPSPEPRRSCDEGGWCEQQDGRAHHPPSDAVARPGRASFVHVPDCQVRTDAADGNGKSGKGE